MFTACRVPLSSAFGSLKESHLQESLTICVEQPAPGICLTHATQNWLGIVMEGCVVSVDVKHHRCKSVASYTNHRIH